MEQDAEAIPGSILDEIVKPTRKVLTQERYLLLHGRHGIRGTCSQPAENMSVVADRCSTDNARERNFSITSKKSFSPKRKNHFFFNSCDKQPAFFKRPEDLKAQASKYGWKCAVLSKDIAAISKHLDDLSDMHAKAVESKYSDIQQILQELNNIKPSVEKLVEKSSIAHSQRRMLGTENYSLQESIKNLKLELAHIKDKQQNFAPMKMSVVTETNSLNRFKLTTELDVEELQLKISRLRKELQKMRDKKSKEVGFLVNSKRRVSEARLNIETLKDAELQRSKSVVSRSKSKRRMAFDVHETPKTNKVVRSATPSKIGKTFHRISQSGL